MHYPQAQREVHFGTAPFDKTGHGETEDDGEEYGEIEDQSEERGLGAVGSQREGGAPDEEALAGEGGADAPGRNILSVRLRIRLVNVPDGRCLWQGPMALFGSCRVCCRVLSVLLSAHVGQWRYCFCCDCRGCCGCCYNVRVRYDGRSQDGYG